MAEVIDDPRSDNMKIKMAEHFESYEVDYRQDDGNQAVVYEDDELLIVADYTGHELSEWAKDFDVSRADLSEFFHDVAYRRHEGEGHDPWATADPVIFDRFVDDE